MEDIKELINNTPVRADIIDLRLELWLRRRDANEIVWTTRGGEKIPIKQMTDKHLINAIILAERIEDRKTQLLELEGCLSTFFLTTEIKFQPFCGVKIQ